MGSIFIRVSWSRPRNSVCSSVKKPTTLIWLIFECKTFVILLFHLIVSWKTLCSHENIEHDASLSRNDIYFGDNYSFNETFFSTLVNVSDPSSLAYNATDAGKAMKTRLEQSMATNPELINTSKEYVIRSREASLYLAVMGNATTGVAKKE